MNPIKGVSVKNLLLVSALVISLVGCATNVWDKPGAGQGDFASDRYGCLQQAQQQSSSAFIGKTGGAAVNGMGTNDGLFSACMNSKGWTLIARALPNSAPATNPLTESGKTLSAENAAMCLRAEMQSIMAKSACEAKLITLPQLADEIYLNSYDKEQFSVWRSEMTTRNGRAFMALRQYGGEKGALMAMAGDAADLQLDQQSLSLYTGKITWGQYNQARKNIFQMRSEEIAKIQAKR